jgi:hypothetical protein
MAVGIHIVKVGMVNIDGTGTFVDRSAATIGQVMNSSQELRVLPESTVPNSANYPTVDAYLRLEAAIDYVLHYMDQYTIVTYES